MTQSFSVQPIELRVIGQVTPVPTTLPTASGNHIYPTQSDCTWVSVFTVFVCFVRKYELLILRGTCHIKPFLLSNIHIELLRRWCSLATSCQQLATSHHDSFFVFFFPGRLLCFPCPWNHRFYFRSWPCFCCVFLQDILVGLGIFKQVDLFIVCRFIRPAFSSATENKNACSSSFAHGVVLWEFQFLIHENKKTFTQVVHVQMSVCESPTRPSSKLLHNQCPALCYVTTIVPGQHTANPKEAGTKMATVETMY